jgi:hypothetical protein
MLGGDPHPAVIDAREAIELETRARLDVNRRAWKAIRLAPTIAIFESLVRVESVPVEKLDQSWVRRFGLRPGLLRGARHRADDFNGVPAVLPEAPRVLLEEHGELTTAGGPA